MRLPGLSLRGLAFHRRTHLAVALGVLAGTAVLTGALIVGDSMRGSLRELALLRLGRIDHALQSGRFFREDLAATVAAAPGPGVAFEGVAPAILLRGSATHADSDARVNRVNVYGVDDGFWALDDTLTEDRATELREKLSGRRSVVLNQTLADELGAKPQDRILLRLEKVSTVHRETVLGRKDETSLSLRVTVEDVLSPRGLGAFTKNPGQVAPKNAYLSIAALQRALEQEGRINSILVAEREEGGEPDRSAEEALGLTLGSALTLADVDLRIEIDEKQGYARLESERLLLEPAVEEAATRALEKLGNPSFPVYTYLANSIVVDDSDGEPRSLPYSTVSAVDLSRRLPGPAGEFRTLDGKPIESLARDEIVLNRWAAEDLDAEVGATVVMSYFVDGPQGQLLTREHPFRIAAISRMEGLGGDPGLAPEVRGMTDVQDISDWDPPFPVDFNKIRQKDEDYWDEYRTVPKAFLDLTRAQELWSGEENRFGRLTSIQVAPASGQSLEETAKAFERELLAHLDPARMGLVFEPIRRLALEASRGATDFGGLFLGFSFFIIVSAALLVALLFRLGVELRAKEVGILRAVGYTDGMISRILLFEGALVAGFGGLLGVAASVGYASLLLEYLRWSWDDAVGPSFLALHVTGISLAIGGVSGFVVAVVSMVFGLRGLKRLSPRALLAGSVSSGSSLAPASHGKIAPALAVGGLLGAAGLLAAGITGAIPQAGAFFGVGSLLLVGLLAGLLVRVRNAREGLLRGGAMGMIRLGIRNASAQPRRLLITAGLVASASFVLIAVGAFRQEGGHDPTERDSGTGGFLLVGESALPLYEDLDLAEGRESLALSDDLAGKLSAGRVISCRLNDGEESSCLNLYQPTRPRVVGVPQALRDRGGFAFSGSEATTEEEERNPWLLLDRPLPDGAIPVIGDANAVQYQLKSGLGKDLVIPDGSGEPVRLRFVALLRSSMLQGEILVKEDDFVALFPGSSGYRFFLVETPVVGSDELGLKLEKELGDFGFDVVRAGDRLAQYHAVENTYLSTFQILGGLGLLLGTLGLATVVLRNVLERRGQYALMRAVGYGRSNLGLMVLAENGTLLGAGLLVGGLSALFAIAPQLASGPADVSWITLILSIVSVFITGMAAGSLAIIATVRAPLIPSLRSE